MRLLKCLVLTLTLLAAAGVAPCAHAAGRVALTFDDLPGLSLFTDQPYLNYLNDTLLRGLKRHHLPATGFVIGKPLDQANGAEQVANLEKWLSAGMNLGNHTYSHESPDAIGAQAYIADIQKAEPVVRALLQQHGKTLGWFRHPYLETGFPEAMKRRIDDWLATHGYRVAPVTIDADDWEFAEPYDDAIARHDEARRLRIKAQYLAYTERTIGWYQSASDAVFGRQIAFVMLLHDTRLNADSIDDLSRILKRRKLKAVTLEEAMRDPAYRLGDPYVGPDGIDWIERWSDELHMPLPWATWRDPPEQIVQEYDAVNNDRIRPTAARSAPAVTPSGTRSAAPGPPPR